MLDIFSYYIIARINWLGGTSIVTLRPARLYPALSKYVIPSATIHFGVAETMKAVPM